MGAECFWIEGRDNLCLPEQYNYYYRQRVDRSRSGPLGHTRYYCTYYYGQRVDRSRGDHGGAHTKGCKPQALSESGDDLRVSETTGRRWRLPYTASSPISRGSWRAASSGHKTEPSRHLGCPPSVGDLGRRSELHSRPAGVDVRGTGLSVRLLQHGDIQTYHLRCSVARAPARGSGRDYWMAPRSSG